LPSLGQRIQGRAGNAPSGSYTHRLLTDDALLAAKIVEEANELVEANQSDEVAEEAADLLYFTLVKLARHGVSLSDVTAVLDRRARTVTRRPGLAKPTGVNP
jgi:phosphoribosyl-ATP pyrophosphohydrolase/phosphoribosyl-AMP cyclohydrolase/histidinol dehydrogenase